MVRIIETPRVIPAAGTPPKTIVEYIGQAVSGTPEVSIARMVSPPGWSEPYQTPEFDEYTVVLKGSLWIETPSETITVMEGQAVIVPKGSKIRYYTPEGAEYIAVCTPAFSPQAVHREPDPIPEKGKEDTEQSISYHIHATGTEDIDRIESLWGFLRECIIPRNLLFSGQMRRLRFSDRKLDLIQKNTERNIRIFFAVDDGTGKDIGYCLCSAASGSFGEIESIFVVEDARSKGIGTTMMVHAISWIKEVGADNIRVHVTVGNEDVMDFYRKFGLHTRQYILSNPEEI